MILRMFSAALWLYVFVAALVSAATPEVRVAVLANFPPQYSTAADGKPTGFAVDSFNEIARIAGLQVRYVVKGSWEEAHKALRDEEVDVIPNMGITSRRKEDYSFTRPVETFSVSIFTRTSNQDMSGHTDLSGKRLGVVRLNVGETLARRFPDAEVQLYDHVGDTIFAVLSGNVDAIIFPRPVVLRLCRASGIEDRIKVVGPPLLEVHRAVAVRKGRDALLQRLDGAAASFIASPQYSTIYARWYGSSQPYWTAQRVLWVMGGLVAVVALGMGLWRLHSILALNRVLRLSIEKERNTALELKEARDTLEERVVERTRDLKQALDEVKTLHGLLPMCSVCKKVRNDSGYWDQLEEYVSRHTDAQISHGICPDCLEQQYPEIHDRLKKGGGG